MRIRSRMPTVVLDKLLANLSIEVQPFALCHVGAGWRLNLPPPPVPMLHYVLKGEGAVGGPGGLRPISTSWMAIIPPDVNHLLQAAEPIEHELTIEPPPDGSPVCRLLGGAPTDASLLVACGLVNVRYGPGLDLFGHLRHVLMADMSGLPQVRAAFDGILAEQAGIAPGSVAMTHALMTQCLVQFLRRIGADDALPWLDALDDPRLGRVIDHILETPSAPHTVDTLAEAASMSRSAFAERFVAAFGQSPMALVGQVRMQHAAHLLRGDRTLSIDTVAGRSGYASRSHFSAAFRKHHGMSPTEFRTAAA